MRLRGDGFGTTRGNMRTTLSVHRRAYRDTLRPEWPAKTCLVISDGTVMRHRVLQLGEGERDICLRCHNQTVLLVSVDAKHKIVGERIITLLGLCSSVRHSHVL